MVKNFTGPSKEEILADNKQTKSFFERAKKITKDSIGDIYSLIGGISEYCQIHYTRYRKQLQELRAILSDCIASICNNDNLGFVRLSEFLSVREPVYEKV
jgi:hypothetical protein